MRSRAGLKRRTSRNRTTIVCVDCYHKCAFSVTVRFGFDLKGDEALCDPGMDRIKCQIRGHLKESSLGLRVTKGIDIK